MAVEDFIQVFKSEFNNKQTHLVSKQMLDSFTKKIKNIFPTFVATVVTDKHGFPMHSEILNSLDENLLALSAVVNKRKIIDLSDYHSLIRPLSKNVKILLLLEKSWENYKKYYEFENILRTENPI